MHIPQSLVKVALPLKANVGRRYDSQGRHIAYTLRHAGYTYNRATVSGMVALIKFLFR